jgi:hypothetical protein
LERSNGLFEASNGPLERSNGHCPSLKSRELPPDFRQKSL